MALGHTGFFLSWGFPQIDSWFSLLFISSYKTREFLCFLSVALDGGLNFIRWIQGEWRRFSLRDLAFIFFVFRGLAPSFLGGMESALRGGEQIKTVLPIKFRKESK